MLELTLSIPASVTSSAHENGIVIMDLAKGRLFAANRTGALIWRTLEQQQPPEAIADVLSRAHGIPLETARAHTARFVSQLAAHNLVSAAARQ